MPTQQRTHKLDAPAAMAPQRLYCFAAVLCAACLVPRAAAAALNVVATLPDLAAIAKEVTGERATIAVLAPPTQDPHYVDPRPSLVLPISRADLLIVNGLELEGGWLPRLLVNARNPRVQVGSAGYFDASQHVERLGVPRGRIDRGMGDLHGGGNPHFTLDPRQAAHIAEALAVELARLDPAGRAHYEGRAQQFAGQLRAFAKAEAARFRALPTQSRRLVSYHASMTYLFHWLGCTAVTTVEPQPGIPPDPGHVASVLKEIRQQGVRAIVQEEHHPQVTSKTLAKLGNARLVVIETATRFHSGQRYLDHVRTIIGELHDALDG